MQQIVLKTIKDHAMICEGDVVIVALSGGADSVALFDFMRTNAAKLGIKKLYAAHFEHGIRGEESQKDAEFVRKICVECRIELFIEYGEMDKKCRPKGYGTEQWARALRYEFFERLAAEYGAKIATAHTLSDNAETVLFNAVRGSGTIGLAGIPPVRGCFIRPFINVSRGYVEDYCAKQKLNFVQDCTNSDVAYSRNRIRHKVLPELEKTHAGAAVALGRMAADMRELDLWIERQAQDLLDGAFSEKIIQGCSGYNVKKLLCAPVPVCKKAIAVLAGKDVDRAAIGRVFMVLRGEIAGTQLPGKKKAVRRKGYLFFEDELKASSVKQECLTPLRAGLIKLPNDIALEVSVCDSDDFCKKTAISDKKGLTFIADYDKINVHGVFRNRQAGDVIAPRGRKFTKPLKKWMYEEGIRAEDRNSLPVLAYNSNIMWVWGYGFCEGFEPDDKTKRYLIITIAQCEGE